MKTLFFIFIFLILSTFLTATIINIPADQPTIQAGIDTAVDADTVLVQPGTYYENINYNGKNITIASLFLTTQDTTYISQTIIDGNQNGSVVTFESGGDSTAVLCGLTITNGFAENGGGIYLNGNVSLILMNCIINNNYANDNGGGLWAINVSNILIRNSIFHHNTSVLGCAAIDIWGSNINISNCTIINNSSLYPVEGGAVGLYSGGSTTNADIRNVIISNNIGYGISNFFDSNLNVEFSDIWNNSLGNFYDCDPNLGVNAITNVNGDSCDIYYNIQLEPSLVDTFNGDYYLNSNSPCIDAGSPNPQFNDPDGTRADMGAYYHHQDNPTFPNYSLSFDGIDDYVHLNTSGGLNISTSATIQAWVKITGAQPNDYHTRIFDSDEGFGGDRFLLSIEGTGTGHLGELNVNGVSIHTSDINLDEWTNVAATCDGQYLRIYKNGLLEDSSLYTTVINLLNDSYIGSAPLAHTLDGLIDEVYLWNVALSDVDIQNNMYLTLNGNETGLVGCWQFNEGTGTIAFDATSNSTNGTIYEATWSTDVPVFELTTNFSADPITGYVPLIVNFTDLSLGNITNWSWDFQNDNEYDSFEQNPTFTYTDAGIYSVKLKVSDGVNVDSLVMNNYITVVFVPPAPPTNVQVDIVPPDAIITWAAVDTTIFGDPIIPDGYIVLNNEDPYADFIYLSFTQETTYTHIYVGQYIDQMFYRVVAVINLSREEIKYLLSLNNSRNKVKWLDVKRNFNVNFLHSNKRSS
jgi:hypothetical protein